LRPAGGSRTISRVSEELVRREEVEAAIEARRELGAYLEPQGIDAFVERIEERLASRQVASEQSLKRRRDHQRELVLGAMGISVPLLLIAAIFTGLPGVLAVCAALAVIAIVTAFQR
jgi:VIT1/CCC1 family predicted Fe2+/Mn2+ transporter